MSERPAVKGASPPPAEPATTAPAGAGPGAALLELDGLTRHYGGVRAIDGVTWRADRGLLHGLIGPNGAGKTTLLNLVSGLVAPTQGRIRLTGRDVTGWAPHRRAAAGLARTFQTARLFRGTTALENVVAAMHARRRPDVALELVPNPWAARARRAREEEAAAHLARVGLAGRGGELAGRLPFGDQRRLEMARALALRPRLLLLDEPAAGMNPAETERLRALLADLRAEGLTMLLVEHHLDLVVRLCDRVTVLDFGRVIAEGTPAEVTRDRRVVEAYLGRAATAADA